MTLLVGRQEGHPACKKLDWWVAGVVICLERGADLHMAQLMPLPLTVSCFSKIQTGFTFLVPAHPGSPGKRADKRVCACVIIFSTQNSEVTSHTWLQICPPHMSMSTHYFVQCRRPSSACEQCCRCHCRLRWSVSPRLSAF